MTTVPSRTVSAVLSNLDTNFSAFGTAFCEGQYALWLGSGISRDKVMNVSALLERIIEHLRSNIEEGNKDCKFRSALDEVLQLANLQPDELDSINFSDSFGTWSLRKRITSSLIASYSRVLDVYMGDSYPEDYLVWTALDVPNTYGAPDLQPDVEHYCIAILMMEGLVSSAVTANWDELLEKALRELAADFESRVRVVVRPEDFRKTRPLIDVIKFHGCAARARDNEHLYRRLLIARESQISRWTAQPKNRSMRKHLELLYTDRPTLMLGLSAQDANLHTVFANAIVDLGRPWPSDAPALVLSEEGLEPHHRHLLKLTYNGDYAGNSSEITESALLGSYAKPTLLALVLSALVDKLSYLLTAQVKDKWDTAGVKQLQDGLRALRDSVALYADPDTAEAVNHEARVEHQRAFVSQLVDVVNLVLTTFRTGTFPAPHNRRYTQISERPVASASLNPDFPTREFGEFGVALALVGRGLASGKWSVVPGDSKSPGDGVLRLITSDRTTQVFFVKDSLVLTQLQVACTLDITDPEVLIVIADEEPTVQTRSPRAHFGRDGKTKSGLFSVSSAIAETTSPEDLDEAFELAGGL